MLWKDKFFSFLFFTCRDDTCISGNGQHKLHVSRLSLLCTLPYIGYKYAESFKLDFEVILLLNILINVDTQDTKAIFI